MLLVLLNQMDQKCSYSSARVLYQGKYDSAGIMHINKASRFNLEPVSERETACH